MKINSSILILSLSLLFLSCGNTNQEIKIENTNQEVLTNILATIEIKNEVEPLATSIDLTIYALGCYEKVKEKPSRFISLTDTYPWSEHPDSLAISDEYLGDEEILDYHILNSKFRTRFLKKLNIKESDSIFLYNFILDKTEAFRVKEIPILAHLTPYGADSPISQYDYLIGFDLEKASPIKDYQSCYGAFVFVGNKNPFISGGLKPIIWKKIDVKLFPKDRASKKIAKTKITKLYEYQWSNFTYYLINEIHLVIVESSSNKLITEAVFEEGESTGLALLSFKNQKNEYGTEQWTGNLFKNKPPVFFGFTYESFGCPSINFIEKSGKEIYINCDNRH
jgi:hypothetical protein